MPSQILRSPMTSEASAGLAKRFRPLSQYAASEEGDASYTLLPFNFTKLGNNYLISNDAGEHSLLRRAELVELIDGQLRFGSEVYNRLRAKHFLYDRTSDAALDLLALKVRTKYSALREFTGLHIFVVTLRCDYSCPYCQVSRQAGSDSAYDMTEEMAERALEMVFKSPSSSLKIEFQGGEPLLNFPLIKFIVERATALNQSERRDLQFVIATNLSFLSDEILDFCETYDVSLSTSLDGPADLHNRNRPRPGKNGHELTRTAIARVRERLGPDRVAALMTTTERSLSRPEDIIDEYLDAGFSSIFLRPLSPYGFAVKTRQVDKYDMERFFDFYKRGLSYIIDLNKRGVPFREEYTTLVLRKLCSPFPTSYVDLQSPAGAGLAVIVFNYNGDVYPTDESRMLTEMGDDSLRLGNVLTDTYEHVFLNPQLLRMLEESAAQSTPECYQCAYQPFCGSDPTYHYATQGDWVGHKAFSGFCARTKLVTGHLIEMLDREGSETQNILLSWV